MSDGYDDYNNSECDEEENGDDIGTSIGCLVCFILIIIVIAYSCFS